MITKLAKKITSYYIHKKIISSDEREIYDYCFETLLSTLLNLCAIIVIAICTKIYLESFIFCATFMMLRGCAGGYHAKHHFSCFLSLMTFYAGLIFCILFIPHGLFLFVSKFLIIISALIIMLLSPVDCSNKRLESSEKNKQRKKSFLLVAFFSTIYIFLSLLDLPKYGFCISYTMSCVSLLLLVGAIQNKLIARRVSEIEDYFDSSNN